MWNISVIEKENIFLLNPVICSLWFSICRRISHFFFLYFQNGLPPQNGFHSLRSLLLLTAFSFRALFLSSADINPQWAAIILEKKSALSTHTNDVHLAILMAFFIKILKIFAKIFIFSLNFIFGYSVIWLFGLVYFILVSLQSVFA